MSDHERGMQAVCLEPGGSRRASRQAMGAHLELVKIKLTALVLFTTAAGFVAGSAGPVDLPVLLWTLLGTVLSAAGAIALNQWMEIARDARMERTRMRPLPAGRMSPGYALAFASLAVLSGLGVLAGRVNLLTGSLAAAVVALYILIYTPMKHRTPFCTLAGAICGAIPPMMGWAGASGALGAGAWILGGILFLWQIPHFLALAWLYREDYARGGFRMLPSFDPTGRRTGGTAVLCIFLLLLGGPLVGILGISGMTFGVGSFLLSLGLLVLGLRLWRDRSEPNARHLLLGSVLYLPLLLGLLLAGLGKR